MGAEAPTYGIKDCYHHNMWWYAMQFTSTNTLKGDYPSLDLHIIAVESPYETFEDSGHVVVSCCVRCRF
jgi:hypothetical protein